MDNTTFEIAQKKLALIKELENHADEIEKFSIKDTSLCLESNEGCGPVHTYLKPIFLLVTPDKLIEFYLNSVKSEIEIIKKQFADL